MGEHSELKNAQAQNSKGFFERYDVRNICDTLLFSAGADWWRISEFDDQAIPADELEQRRNEFASIVSALDAHGTWVVKEPRLCLLLKVLLPVISDPVCILALRHPMEVAVSLQVRNGLSILQGLALWEAYTRAALRVSEALPRIFVSYERLVAEPLVEASRMVEELSGFGVNGLSVPNSVVDFIAPELHRQRQRDGEKFINPSQNMLWDHLGSNTDLHLEAKKRLSASTVQHLHDLETQYPLIQADKVGLETLSARAKTLSARAKTLSTKLSAARTRTEGLKSGLTAMRRRKGDMRKKLAKCEKRLEKVVKTVERERGKLQKVEKQVAAVYTSASWKITAVVRIIGSAVGRLQRRATRSTASHK